MARQITRDDILSMEAYGAIRRDKAREISAAKRHRRMGVGPDATIYFENYDTMWRQIHEMLFIERGGEAQIDDELEAYNPLIPQGRELVATLMFEIPNRERRQQVLGRLGGVEETVCLHLGDERIAAQAETDVDRTTAEGKASSVHFLHFPFTDAQVRRFSDPETEVVLAIEHPNYAHTAGMPADVRAALAGDFD
ncbi:DUF3501 family protein [Arhodomonas aquaeolei]|uniref:DUF3501 family protein n=1 Tax=Arhodomonas aquaeolei TaxID=2369 RepID=UPI0021677861|nr:DUF3501 family protein [Arhodomonas aquaeolei]MCS4504024.1 DUF3501 family protein [Arhodomonas aquaeolei]